MTIRNRSDMRKSTVSATESVMSAHIRDASGSRYGERLQMRGIVEISGSRFTFLLP